MEIEKELGKAKHKDLDMERIEAEQVEAMDRHSEDVFTRLANEHIKYKVLKVIPMIF